MILLDKIIIAGAMGSGKDEMAKYLVEKHGFVQVSFAEPIYWVARNIFRMKQKNRKLLQDIGEAGRALWSNIWVFITFYKVNKLIKQGKRVVISDLRRENEYLAALENDFLPLRVVADEDIRISRLIIRDGYIPCPHLMYNSSETGVDHIEMIPVTNNGSMEELHSKIDDLLLGKGLFLNG